MVTPRKPDPDKTIYDSAEACWILGISYKTLTALIGKGLPAKNIGNHKRAQYLFLKSDIEEWMRDDELTARAIIAEMR
jgi:predicted site-specific integrase-resolvase